MTTPDLNQLTIAGRVKTPPQVQEQGCGLCQLYESNPKADKERT
jgi:hypothetical protein